MVPDMHGPHLSMIIAQIVYPRLSIPTLSRSFAVDLRRYFRNTRGCFPGGGLRVLILFVGKFEVFEADLLLQATYARRYPIRSKHPPAPLPQL
jgi:hypothetical protein